MLQVEEMLPLDQSRIIEQAKFTCSPLGKPFQKQIKTIENRNKKQIKTNEEHAKKSSESNALIRKYDYDTEIDSS